jgi:hypothetical protein
MDRVSNGQALIDDLFKQIIGPFAATGVTPLLFEPDNVEDRVKNLVSAFTRHPHLIPPFQSLIKALNPQDIEVPLEEHIRFYTTRSTRLWLLVNLFHQTLQLKELQMDETTGKLPAKASDLLKFSNEAREMFGDESRYKDLVFAGGLLFDFLFYLQRTPLMNLGGAKFDETISQAFQRSVEQGQLIIKIARYKSKLSLERLAPVTAFIRQLAQVSLCMLKPSEGPEFYKKVSQLKLTEQVQLALEYNKFGVHTGILATFLAQMIPEFSPLESAMSVWGAPYLSWQSGLRDVHDLCGMGMLGAALRERVTGGDFPGAGRVGDTLGELKFLDLAITAEVKSEAKI